MPALFRMVMKDPMEALSIADLLNASKRQDLQFASVQKHLIAIEAAEKR